MAIGKNFQSAGSFNSGSRPTSRPTSGRPASGRPISAALSETGAWRLNVQREDGPARQQRAIASDTLSRTALEEFIGDLNKTGRPLREYTTRGGLYLKYKAARNMDDPASKALGAENVDRLLAEICLSSPSVRTVLRITDDLELSEQTTSSGSDDLVKEIVGTASASFMTALARLAELREEVQEHREEKKKQANANLSKVAYQALYGMKKAVMQEPKLEQVTRARRRRSSVGSVPSEVSEVHFDEEQMFKDSTKRFDDWMWNHLKTERKLARQRQCPRLPPVRLDMRLLGLA
ncbi:unnamed protein product [Cladocopium goreaui]|uniref:Myosin heavy chain kinase C n=1 Tax=Cladocopium goreaui TaxID=2562237 RepID=A0A9P1G647_9DINO|nr:unnamed protein product [Cladocopium goreaui]